MSTMFPRTTVGGVSLSRMIIGTNWILGYSHTSVAADDYIKKIFSEPEAVCTLLTAYLSKGVDTLMAPYGQSTILQAGVKMAEDKCGQPITIIDTPIINVGDSEADRREAAATIKQSAQLGAKLCLPHHSSVEQLVCKHSQTIERLPDYLAMIRDCGLVPGLSAHMPELVVYSDLNGYDVETYIQLYNCMGFLMQVEVEYINKVIWEAKRPVITIKPMAAGRVSPFVGITFNYATIRDCDMVAVGAFTAAEALEDIEIGMAAIERRRADLEGRSSPNKTAIMGNLG